jgi:hypothetical protein
MLNGSITHRGSAGTSLLFQLQKNWFMIKTLAAEALSHRAPIHTGVDII